MTETEYLRGYRDALAESLARIKADPYLRPEPPARIPEPGLWGVVEAHLPDQRHDVDDWTRRRQGWHCPTHGFAEWDVLIDPVLIRDGVTS
jgi:hypothetical protein